ncbi:MAG: nicotinate-nucleotide--dimethylbenzimidazole phosphoribosyltransferase [Planctomycetota bacterium]
MNPLEGTLAEIRPPDEAARAKAKARLDSLTMPHWALGRLMDLALDLAGMTGQVPPPVARRRIAVFAGDHGVTAEGVSLYPAEVTGQMVRNFARGGAGINAFSRITGARIVITDMGVAADLEDLAASGVIVSKRIGPGTRNIARGPAMTPEEARRAVEAGIEIARDFTRDAHLVGAGDMGIGNTTPSAAIVAAVTGSAVADVTGRGTGVDDAGLARKVAVVEKALAVNRPTPTDGLDLLAKVGGFEIGGIAGFILGAAAQRKPVLVDGYISTAGAMIAALLAPASRDYMISAHRSVEPGHAIALEWLGKQPLLALDMRLGEGTGAALAMPLVEAAARLLSDVATFEEAAVSRPG